MSSTLDTASVIWGWTMSGRPLNMIEAAIMLGDLDYRKVARTPLFRTHPVPKRIEIKTVFLVQGSHRSRYMPALYETAVVHDGQHLILARSRTFDDALRTHRVLIEHIIREGRYQLALPSPDNLDRWL